MPTKTAKPPPANNDRNTQQLTVGAIAKLLNVAPRTVAKWVDAKLLKGYRLPSCGKYLGQRRVFLADLEDYCRKNNLPLDRLRAAE